MVMSSFLCVFGSFFCFQLLSKTAFTTELALARWSCASCPAVVTHTNDFIRILYSIFSFRSRLLPPPQFSTLVLYVARKSITDTLSLFHLSHSLPLGIKIISFASFCSCSLLSFQISTMTVSPTSNLHATFAYHVKLFISNRLTYFIVTCLPWYSLVLNFQLLTKTLYHHNFHADHVFHAI